MKKVLSAILCLIMLVSACVSFAGCGKKYDESYVDRILEGNARKILEMTEE